MYFANLISPNVSIFRYDFNERRVYPATIVGETLVSFIIPIEGCPSQFAVSAGRSMKIIEWDGVSREAHVICTVFDVEPNNSQNRFDGK